VTSQENSKPFFLFLFFAALFSLQVLPQLSANSLTNDEPTDIANGYYYWTQGDVVTPHNHPPLGSALQALPLLFMGLKTLPYSGDVIDRGHFFVFQWNLSRLESITLASRMVSWLLGLGVGFLLWRVTRAKLILSAVVLFFWALDPAFDALSGLAKTDIAPALFFFLAVLAFDKSQREPSLRRSIVAGILTGFAVNAKFYCLVLFPLFLVLEFLFYRQKENLLFLKERRIEIRDRWIHGVGSFFVTTFLIFLPASLLWPDHHQPFHYVVDKFKEDLAFAQSPFPVFFLGNSGLDSHWYYLPAAFLLKEPLPFIFFLAAGCALAFSGKIRLKPWQWVSPLVFFLALLPSLNLGVRYLLPALPFLFSIAGEAAAGMWNGVQGKSPGGPLRTLVIVLFLWQAASVALHFQNTISYFNELVPGDRKIHYLADSNLDWGQDQKRLAETAKRRGWGKVHLAYFGGIDPGFYGLDWQPWVESDLKAPQPGTVYVINASFLQLAPEAYPPTSAIALGWIAERTPTGKVGDSWYYFEIPGTPVKLPHDPILVSAPFLEYRGYSFYHPAMDPGLIR
jgi:hypothetical protein